MKKVLTLEVPDEGFVNAWLIDESTLLLQKENNEAAVFSIKDKIIVTRLSLPSRISASLLFSDKELIIGCESSSIRICHLNVSSPDQAISVLNNLERRAPIQSIAKMNDGQFVTADVSGVLKIWDVNTRECIHEHKFDHSVLAIHAVSDDELVILATNSISYYEYRYSISAQSTKQEKSFRASGQCSFQPIKQVVIETPDKIKIFRSPNKKEGPLSIWVEESPKDPASSVCEVSCTLAPDDSPGVASVLTRGNWACYFSPREHRITLVEDPELRSISGQKVISK